MHENEKNDLPLNSPMAFVISGLIFHALRDLASGGST